MTQEQTNLLRSTLFKLAPDQSDTERQYKDGIWIEKGVQLTEQ